MECSWIADNDKNSEARKHANDNPGHLIVKSTSKTYYWRRDAVGDGQDRPTELPDKSGDGLQ